MPVTLSVADVRLLGAASTAILAPEAELPFDAWRLAVNGALCELVQGDFAIFGVATPEAKSAVCADRPSELIRAVESIFASPEDTGNVRGTSFGLEVLTLDRVVAGDWEAYERDWAVNEVFRPNGMTDLVSLSLHWTGSEPSSSGAVMASVYRDVHGSKRFGEVGATMFELLLPAFRSAIATRVRGRNGRATSHDINAMLEATRSAALLLNTRGDVLHESAGLSRLLASDSDPSALRAALRRAGMSLVASLHARRHSDAGDPRSSVALGASSVVRTHSAAYHVHAAYVNDHHGDRLVVASIERLTPTPLNHHALAARYALTPRQTEVAVLLAAGLSNDEIARQLGVRPHTARRHTEQVLAKLGVARRAAVGAKLRAD